MAMEIMVVTPAIRNLIREEKIHQIYSSMQAGQKFGMQTMNQSLLNLIQRGKISREDALNRTTDPQELLRLLEGVVPGARAAAVTAQSGSPFARRCRRERRSRSDEDTVIRERLEWRSSHIGDVPRPACRRERSRLRTGWPPSANCVAAPSW